MLRQVNRLARSSYRRSTHRGIFALGLLFSLAAPGAAVVYTYENSTSAAVPNSVDTSTGTVAYASSGAAVSITDDGYNGTQASMACKTIAVASEPGLNTILGPVTVSVSITHTFVGHLTIKLFSPTDSFTLMSRPGTTEAADNGGGAGTGDSTNIAGGTPVTFAMASATEAETMGGGLTNGQTVCLSGGACSFNPDNGASTLSEDLADLNGDSKVGNWTLCVGDSITGETGTLDNWSLNLGTAPGTGGDTGCDDGSSALNVSFAVGDSFTVSSIALGLNVSHTNRGQLRASLVAPDNSTLQLLTQTAGATDDPDDNYDVYFSPLSDGAGSNPVDDGDADPVAEPYYHRLINAATGFYSGNAAGTWTLRICDRFDEGTTGTFNRARLVLDDGVAYAPRCTSRTTFDFCPGCAESPPAGATSTAYPGGGITAGGVTLNLTATILTDATGSARNFSVVNTQTGGEFGYYVTEFDASAAQVETVRSETTWTFTPAVTDLQWAQKDQDNSSWEDYTRVRGLFNGAEVRYSISQDAAPAYQISGEILETDTNSTPPDTFGNAYWNFQGAVSTVRSEYWAGDDFANPSQQFIGYGALLYCGFDFGDGPSSYGTPLSGTGTAPKHVLGDRSIFLGANRPDGEADSAPSAAATADDTTQVPSSGVDDEDGVSSFPSCPGDGTYTVSVSASDVRTSGSDATLYGYIDWNRDGDFNDAGERSNPVVVPRTNADPTSYNVTWSGVPSGCGGTTSTYARFRISTDATRAGSPTDTASTYAPDGEVEDYQISNGTLPVTIAHVTSERRGGEVEVRWTTATETLNAGFRIWGLDARGERRLLTSVKSQGSDSFRPQSYSARVSGKGISAFEIEDVGVAGENRLHGPFTVGAEVGAAPDGQAIDWAGIRGESGLRPLASLAGRATDAPASLAAFAGMAGGSAQAKARLLVRDEGIQRVTYEQLLAAGADLGNLQPGKIAVINNGLGVPRYVETVGGRFGPGSFIEFVAKPELTLASPVDVFLVESNPAKAVPAGSFVPGSGSLATVAAEDRHRDDRVYSYSSPTADPWFEQQLLAWGGAATLTRTFDLPDLAAGPVMLDLSAWGWGDWQGAAPDHHLVVTVNGTEALNETYDGITALERSVDLQGLVTATGNEIQVTAPGDTGYLFDNQAYDGFTVRYSRASMARDESFQGEVTGSSAPGLGRGRRPQSTPTGFAIGGFSGGQFVSVWSITGGVASRSLQAPVGGQVVAPTGAQVYAAGLSAIQRPGILAGVPAAASPSDAQYLIVTHPSFADHLGGLVALEQAKGLTTEVVTTDRIYAAYSDHAASAEAIRSYLTASAGGGHLRYVLLVGADSTDPYDHLGLGSISFVPTLYGAYTPYISYSPTDEALVDANGDGVGEALIGRLPVRTVAELETTIAKLATWEQNVDSTARAAFLVGGKSDSEAAVAPINAAYEQALASWNAVAANVDEYGVTAIHDAIVGALNAGTPLVSYVGHSAPSTWDNTAVLRSSDVAGLVSSGHTNLVTQWGCWNSYYVEPTYQSLSALLLTSPNASPASAIGAMTRTSDAAHQALGTLFFQHVAAGAPTVGDAFHAAKADLAAQGWGMDALLGMALLGDPAMSLPPAE